MSRIKNLEKDYSPPPVYYVSFEDYLKPKGIRMKNSLIFANNAYQRPKSKFLLFKEKVQMLLKLKTKRRIPKIPTSCFIGNIRFPRFLTFLNARNDHTVCKRKSGFEIYCELASIHGFHNFADATTWQRTFWFLVILLAVVMSGSVLLLSKFMNAKTPIMLYSESTQYPTWYLPFPAVTICNINKISKSRSETLAKKFQQTSNISLDELLNSFNLALSATENIRATSADYKNLNKILKRNNYTLLNLLDDIGPNCNKQLLRCTFQRQFLRCGHIFKKIQTTFGQCCSFNNKALLNILSGESTANDEKYILNYGYVSGLTVLLDPQLGDYKASSLLTPGFRVFVHDTDDFVDFRTMHGIITPVTVNKIRVWPKQTYATANINSLKLNTRKCYLPNERKLYHFDTYSHSNCLYECLSSLIFKKCQCSLPYWPKMKNWTLCGLEGIQCYLKYKHSLLSLVKPSNSNRNEGQGQFMCDCYPLCAFKIYRITQDSGQLTRKYSITEKRLYKGINVSDHILLRVFIGELHAERLRLDVSESWLTFLGTFGGITGLYMGYSFVSGFELIFFVFVRPACNWWSKKQIENRIKKIQKQKAEQEGTTVNKN